MESKHEFSINSKPTQTTITIHKGLFVDFVTKNMQNISEEQNTRKLFQGTEYIKQIIFNNGT